MSKRSQSRKRQERRNNRKRQEDLQRRNVKKQASILRNEMTAFREAKEEARAEGYTQGLLDAKEAVDGSRTIAIARTRVGELLDGTEDAQEEMAS